MRGRAQPGIRGGILSERTLKDLADAMDLVLVGKKDPIRLLLATLAAGGHLLIEDLPGSGKTLMARTLARGMGGTFKRIQFTPDLLPADVTGFNVYERESGQFRFQAGPVFANILLADEINRTIPRTQASLLECMEERQVTVDGQTMVLPQPFMVVATQNPLDMEGTFPLPEAQLDRFFMRIAMGYPGPGEEVAILERFQQDDPLASLEAVTTPSAVKNLQERCRRTVVAPDVKGYIVAIAEATRRSSLVQHGASPRASLHLMRGAQALALLEGRDYVLPDDVKLLAAPILAHRLVLDLGQRVRDLVPEKVVADILEELPVPVPGSGS